MITFGQRACKEREQALPCSAAALPWYWVGSQNLQVRNSASGCIFTAQKQLENWDTFLSTADCFFKSLRRSESEVLCLVYESVFVVFLITKEKNYTEC